MWPYLHSFQKCHKNTKLQSLKAKTQQHWEMPRCAACRARLCIWWWLRILLFFFKWIIATGEMSQAKWLNMFVYFALFSTVFLPRGNIAFSSLCRLFNNDGSPQKERWHWSEGSGVTVRESFLPKKSSKNALCPPVPISRSTFAIDQFYE